MKIGIYGFGGPNGRALRDIILKYMQHWSPMHRSKESDFDITNKEQEEPFIVFSRFVHPQDLERAHSVGELIEEKCGEFNKEFNGKKWFEDEKLTFRFKLRSIGAKARSA